MPDEPVIKRVKVADLVEDAQNARTHGERNLNTVKGSWSRFGQAETLCIQKGTNTLIGGNGRREVLIQMGVEEVTVIEMDLNDEEARDLSILLNRAGDLAGWNTPLLAQQLKDIQSRDPLGPARLGYDEKELAAALMALNTAPVGGAGSEPEIPALPTDPVTRPGDLYQIGDHVLLCGDCRKSRDMQVLFGEHEINLAVTSPPYASQRKYDEGSEFKPIPPEEYSNWFEAVSARIAQHLAPDGSFMLNIKEHCADGQRDLYVKELIIDHVRNWGWLWVDEYVWTHGGTPRAVVNRFKNGWEPIFHFTRARDHKFKPENVRHWSETVVDWGGAHPSDEDKQGDPKNKFRAKASKGSNSGKQGERGALDGVEDDGAIIAPGWAYPNNVLSLGKNREALGHPAAYPISLPEFFVKAYTDEGDIIFDPFMGSGSTMMAAENLGRRSFGMEISPAYCDVIVNRWEAASGKKAVRRKGLE